VTLQTLSLDSAMIDELNAPALLAALNENGFEIKEVFILGGEWNFSFADKEADNDADAVTRFIAAWEPPPTGWSGFRIGMMNDEAYNRIVLASIPISELNVLWNRIEGVILQNPPHLKVLQALWNRFIQETDSKERPNGAEAQNWNAIALATSVPIQFDNKGLMEINGGAT
jgi:hypothetical protein